MTIHSEEIYLSEFERAVIVSTDEYTFLSIDTYKELNNLDIVKTNGSMSISPITIRYIKVEKDRAYKILPQAIEVEYIILEYRNLKTLISIRIILKPSAKELRADDIITIRDRAISLLTKYLEL